MVDTGSKKNSYKKRLPLLLGILGIAAVFFYFKNKENDYDKWSGNWNITYYYENEKTLLYKGALQINFQGSPTGRLEVFAPYSARPETLDLSGLKRSENGAGIKATVVHNQYKINGGYLKELLELKLESPGKLTGTGRCLEYCAEGTEGAGIIWLGTKTESIK